MKKMSETIVFFGSGPVAAQSLKLLAADFEIEAIITKPQPAHHKQPFPVLSLGHELGIKTLTAGTKAELSEVVKSSDLRSKIGVIIDHGLIISQDVIDYFPYGIVNSHFSLLPLWRGPDPISFAILEGDTRTGVSLMVIVEELDAGQLIAQKSLAIDSDATTPSLTDQLIKLSHQLLVDSLPLYLSRKLTPYPQPASKPSYSQKLTKNDSRLDFNKSAAQLEREVRAYTDWPRSRTKIGEIDVIITRARVAEVSEFADVGKIAGSGGEVGKLQVNNKQLGFLTANGLLIIEKLIPSGKKEMSAEAFLAGYKLFRS